MKGQMQSYFYKSKYSLMCTVIYVDMCTDMCAVVLKKKESSWCWNCWVTDGGGKGEPLSYQKTLSKILSGKNMVLEIIFWKIHFENPLLSIDRWGEKGGERASPLSRALRFLSKISSLSEPRPPIFTLAIFTLHHPGYSTGLKITMMTWSLALSTCFHYNACLWILLAIVYL